MFLHLGNNTVVNTKTIVGIFDLDKITVSKHSREYLKKAEKDGILFSASDGLPKSLIVCATKDEKRLYLSQLSPSTLFRSRFTLRR